MLFHQQARNLLYTYKPSKYSTLARSCILPEQHVHKGIGFYSSSAV